MTLPTKDVSYRWKQVFNLVNIMLGVVFGLLSLAVSFGILLLP